MLLNFMLSLRNYSPRRHSRHGLAGIQCHGWQTVEQHHATIHGNWIPAIPAGMTGGVSSYILTGMSGHIYYGEATSAAFQWTQCGL